MINIWLYHFVKDFCAVVIKKMQVSKLVCLQAALVHIGCVDAHVEKLFGIINRLMNEREVSRTSWFLGDFL